MARRSLVILRFFVRACKFSNYCHVFLCVIVDVVVFDVVAGVILDVVVVAFHVLSLIVVVIVIAQIYVVVIVLVVRTGGICGERGGTGVDGGVIDSPTGATIVSHVNIVVAGNVSTYCMR